MGLSEQAVIDAAAEANLPPTEYFAHFETLGLWQLDALKRVGLRPEHALLDVGCGAMRLGVYAVPYLESGFYAGIDAYEPYIRLGRRLAAEAGLPPERYDLLAADDFRLEAFGRSFDVAIAQSVFTHLSAEATGRCVERLRRVMKPGGVLLFTYLVGAPATQGFLYGGVQPMRRLAVDEGFFDRLAMSHGLVFEDPGIDHVSQRVGLYRFPGPPA